ncbi:MAG: hypothetical protein Q9186_001498 [Xanthomendoza sp. 1 TL-2023]
MAVLGSGPSGFYSAYKVMQGIENAKVDMYEYLPVPFGLVRYGVAPDHPEVKNCQDKFTEVASSPNFNFIGNVEVGKDLSLKSFTNHYDAILFAYGASKDRKLGIPGEDKLKGIYSARDFVGWYNGLPEFSRLAPRLEDSDTAVIIGQGNVALDVARTLLKGVDALRTTDMTDQALAVLSRSRVKRVRVVGRRGPMQVSFTIKEVRELMKLPSVAFNPVDATLIPPDVSSLPRTAQRLTKLLIEGSRSGMAQAKKSWGLDFLLSPVQYQPSSGASSLQLGSIEFANMKLVGHDPFDPAAKVERGPDRHSIPTSLAFRSVGYQSEALPGMSELGISFDTKRGIIVNDYYGRLRTPMQDANSAHSIPGMYCAGWVKRGPTGVIANTMEDSFATAEAIIEDWNNKVPFLGGGDGWENIRSEGLIKNTRTRRAKTIVDSSEPPKAESTLTIRDSDEYSTGETIIVQLILSKAGINSDVIESTKQSYSVLYLGSSGSQLDSCIMDIAADYTHVVVGAGAVGLAIARKLAARDGTSTLLIERHGSVGTETSSRNSETKLCLQGKRMMYDLCEKQRIPYRNCQKWILAQNDQQHEQLVKMHEFSNSISVPTHFISLTEAQTREPDVKAQKAVLESPTTGIIDSHTYMAYLESDFQSKGGDLACHTRVTEIAHQASGSQGYSIQTTSSLGEPASITTETLVNSAGLAAVPLSNSILPPDRHVTPYYAKGSYYSYAAAHPRPKTLIYPAPTTGAAGLGTHLTMDMTGAIRFGPDVEWVDDPTNLSVNEERLSAALDEIKTYLPSVDTEKVMLDYAGIRPKLGKGSAVLSGKGDGFSDFYIKKEEGFAGFINLLGIESPGLTSSLAIADMTLKASKALLQHISTESDRKEANSTTKNLLKASSDGHDQDNSADAEPIWLSLTTKKHIVDKHRLKPGKIPLPHSLNQSSTTTICLITCDPQRQVKDVISHPSFPTALSSRITKVLGISKLKARYQPFESRRKLLNEHDIFLADARVVTMLPKILGKIFYQSPKKPVPVNLEPSKQIDAEGKRAAPKNTDENAKRIAPPLQVAKEIEKTINCALVHLSPSNNTAVRIGRSSFTAQQIAENVESVVAGLVEKFIPQGWRNVRAVNIKGPNTMALPIWLANELWMDQADVLEKEEEEKAKDLKALAGLKRKSRALDKAGEAVGESSVKREGVEEANGQKKKKRKVEVEDTDLSQEMRERREKLREQKTLDRAEMHGVGTVKTETAVAT